MFTCLFNLRREKYRLNIGECQKKSLLLSKFGKMASDLELSLRRIAEKSRFLTDRYKSVVDQRDKALARITELEALLEAQTKTVEKLKLELEYMTLASTIAPDRDSLDKTRAMISGLVRDIDRCIADIQS